MRDHLGMETQRQGSDRAVARATPRLLRLFSIVTPLVMSLFVNNARLRVEGAAWYRKARPTFSDILAAVRLQVWREQGALAPRHPAEATNLSPALREGIA